MSPWHDDQQWAIGVAALSGVSEELCNLAIIRYCNRLAAVQHGTAVDIPVRYKTAWCRRRVAGANGRRVAVRVLIVQTAFLGDVVLTLPLIATLQQHFPGVQVDVLTVPAHAAVLQQQPGIHRVIAYDKRGKQRGMRGFLAVMRQIQARRYDVVLAPHRSLRTALLVAWSRASRRIGFARWLTRWAYTTTVPRPVKGHEVERNVHLLRALGVYAVSPAARLRLRVTPAARQTAAAYFTRGGIAAQDVVVGLIPGSQWGTKRWPAERFAALIDHLASTAGPAVRAHWGAARSLHCRSHPRQMHCPGAGPHRPDHLTGVARVSGAVRGGREQRYGTNAHCGGSGATNCGAVRTNDCGDGFCALWGALGGRQCDPGMSSLPCPWSAALSSVSLALHDGAVGGTCCSKCPTVVMPPACSG